MPHRQAWPPLRDPRRPGRTRSPDSGADTRHPRTGDESPDQAWPKLPVDPLQTPLSGGPGITQCHWTKRVRRRGRCPAAGGVCGSQLGIVSSAVFSSFPAVGPESRFWLPVGGYHHDRTSKTHDRGHATRRPLAGYAGRVRQGGAATGRAFRPFRVARKGGGVFRIRLRAKATL